MKIAGLQKNSMVDYPGKISAVVFTQGCNMNCGYCHNRCLIGDQSERLLGEEDIIAFLEKRIGFLDAVVISGGEPTLQRDLVGFADRVKSMGFLVKLDTNGTNPSLLRTLIDRRAVDYVAMDVKAPICKYRQVCCSPVNTANVEKSIAILNEGLVDYEFRTTFTPELDQNDIMDIAAEISGAGRYVLQQYREVDGTNGEYTGRIERRSLYRSILTDIARYVREIRFRGEFAFV
jgi:pyruvate formate lyase activating enzyme